MNFWPYDVDIVESFDKSSHLNQFEELKGHPLPCSSGCCNSQLCILQAAAVHYPSIRIILNNIYCARKNDSDIRRIEYVLSEGCIHSLINNLELQDPSELLDDRLHQKLNLCPPQSHIWRWKLQGLLKNFIKIETRTSIHLL